MWKLRVRQDIKEGFDTEVCIKCGNSDSFTTYPYKAKQEPLCHERLANKYKNDLGANEAIARYSSVPYYTVLHDAFDAFFNNYNSDNNCPVYSCKLKTADCSMD